MPPSAKLGVLILAAGRSRRLAGRVRKPFRNLAGIPLYRHSLDLFRAMNEVSQIVLVVPRGELVRMRAVVRRLDPQGGRLTAVRGGATRAGSVREGLRALPAALRWVAIHDAARPLVTAALARRVFAAARATGGAVPALPVAETLKCGHRGIVVRTVPRQGLWTVQTPQIFRRASLEAAFTRHRGWRRWTDDASAFEAEGLPVRIVLGDRANLKITAPGDLNWAEIFFKIFSSRRCVWPMKRSRSPSLSRDRRFPVGGREERG